MDVGTSRSEPLSSSKMGGRKLLYALVTVAAVVEIVACVGDDPPAGPVKQGVRNGPCYDNNTCNAPLVCSAGTCIDSDAATNGNDASLGDAGVREEAGDGGVCSAAITSQAPSGPLCPGVDDGQCAAGTPCCTLQTCSLSAFPPHTGLLTRRVYYYPGLCLGYLPCRTCGG